MYFTRKILDIRNYEQQKYNTNFEWKKFHIIYTLAGTLKFYLKIVKSIDDTIYLFMRA